MHGLLSAPAILRQESMDSAMIESFRGNNDPLISLLGSITYVVDQGKGL